MIHRHKWGLYDITHAADFFTLLLFGCNKCGKIKTQQIVGHWEWDVIESIWIKVDD